MAPSFPCPLHPDLLTAINSWRTHPELSRLAAKMYAHSEPTGFLDACSEALVARHLLQTSTEVRYEVPTPSGKQCDFQLQFNDTTLYLHIKRLDSIHSEDRHITISSRLRYLERIPRPFIVQIRWPEKPSDTAMQQLVREAAEFIRHAHVGDEHRMNDDEGNEIGGVRIVAPCPGNHVNLVIGLSSGFTDEAQRIRRLLDRAYSQFMPRALNVILIGTSHREERVDMENALLGDHIERWDTHPPKGRRIAHGRASDGFWQGRRCPDSQAALWFHCDPESPGPNLTHNIFLRPKKKIDSTLTEILNRIFDPPPARTPLPEKNRPT